MRFTDNELNDTEKVVMPHYEKESSQPQAEFTKQSHLKDSNDRKVISASDHKLKTSNMEAAKLARHSHADVFNNQPELNFDQVDNENSPSGASVEMQLRTIHPAKTYKDVSKHNLAQSMHKVSLAGLVPNDQNLTAKNSVVDDTSQASMNVNNPDTVQSLDQTLSQESNAGSEADLSLNDDLMDAEVTFEVAEKVRKYSIRPYSLTKPQEGLNEEECEKSNEKISTNLPNDHVENDVNAIIQYEPAGSESYDPNYSNLEDQSNYQDSRNQLQSNSNVINSDILVTGIHSKKPITANKRRFL